MGQCFSDECKLQFSPAKLKETYPEANTMTCEQVSIKSCLCCCYSHFRIPHQIKSNLGNSKIHALMVGLIKSLTFVIVSPIESLHATGLFDLNFNVQEIL